MENLKDIISISDYSKVRKHKQIIDSVLSATRMGSLKFNDKLPSVNELAFDHNVSRDTVFRAYAFLKENNIIESIPGKGYYMKSACTELKVKVFLLFSKLGPYQKKIFDALSNVLNEFATIDFYVYQNDYSQFKKHILNSKSKEYTHYVLNADFEDGEEDAIEFMKSEIPLDKLIMLDKKVAALDGVAGVYQDYENDIFNALSQLNPLLEKYKIIKLVLPENSILPEGIKEGFLKFCNAFAYQFRLVYDTVNVGIEKHTVYINIDESDLIDLVKQIKNSDCIIGEDIGIISYNDSSLKEVLFDGITVISTDFDQLGEQAAYMILRNEKEQVQSRFDVVIRNSL